MTDAELAAAAWKELTKTTDSYPKWKQRGFPPNTGWGRSKAYLDQIGQTAPPPSNVFKNLQRKTDFLAIRNMWSPSGWYAPASTGTAWPNGGGAYEVTTPHGPGMRYRVTADMKTTWAPTVSKTCVGVLQQIDWTGKSIEWHGWVLFPFAGNPNGFSTGWWPGSTLWEVGGTQGGTWGNTIGCTLVMGSDGKVAFNIRKSDTQFPDKPHWTPAPVALDTWHEVRWQVKHTNQSDGFQRGWWNGTKLMDYSGPTLWNDERVWEAITGFYTTISPMNEVWYAGLTLSDIA